MSAADGEAMTGHVYVSTACQHDLHNKCRETCKYCGTKCACSGCDHTDAQLIVNALNLMDEAFEPAHALNLVQPTTPSTSEETP